MRQVLAVLGFYWLLLRDFFASRTRKLWVVVPLLALATWLLMVSAPPKPQDRTLSSLPTPVGFLGEGPVRWHLVLWWRCPACKRLLAGMGPVLEGQKEVPFRVSLYFLDLSPRDAEKTVYTFCRIGEGEPAGILLKRLTFGPEVLPDDLVRSYKDKPCWEEGLRLSGEMRQVLMKQGVSWTPALIQAEERGGRLLAPEPENYDLFLKELGLAGFGGGGP